MTCLRMMFSKYFLKKKKLLSLGEFFSVAKHDQALFPKRRVCPGLIELHLSLEDSGVLLGFCSIKIVVDYWVGGGPVSTSVLCIGDMIDIDTAHEIAGEYGARARIAEGDEFDITLRDAERVIVIVSN